MIDLRQYGTIVSLDYEFDGPNMAQNSLLSIGAVAILPNGESREFSINILPQEGHKPDPITTKTFWENPETGAPARPALFDPPPVPLKEAWDKFDAWLNAIPGKKTMAAYPLNTERTITHYMYLQRGVEPEDSPFGLGGIDLQTFAAKVLHIGYKDAVPAHEWPDNWLEGVSDPDYVPHISIHDARVQDHALRKMIEYGIENGTIRDPNTQRSAGMGR